MLDLQRFPDNIELFRYIKNQIIVNKEYQNHHGQDFSCWEMLNLVKDRTN